MRRRAVRRRKHHCLEPGLRVTWTDKAGVFKRGTVEYVLSVQFTALEDGQDWPEFVMFDDNWDIIL